MNVQVSEGRKYKINLLTSKSPTKYDEEDSQSTLKQNSIIWRSTLDMEAGEDGGKEVFFGGCIDEPCRYGRFQSSFSLHQKKDLLVYNPPFKAPKQLIATRVLNTAAPNLPIVAFPKSNATVFEEATTDGLRTIK